MRFYRIDGIRIDSIVNIASWDFIENFKDTGHRIYPEALARARQRARWSGGALPGCGRGARHALS